MAMIRTIEELHDSKVGHPKFAKVVDLLTEKGYKVTEIREYYEKFDFKVNGVPFAYSKQWKASAKDMVDYTIKLYEMDCQVRLAMAREKRNRK